MKQIWLLLFFTILFFCVHAQFMAERQLLHTATGDLYGSLIIPANKKKFDVVILQPGSGPTDRNGNNPLGVNANSYIMLADSLAHYNIATLLIDKRGVAESKAAGSDESKLVFNDYIYDLEAWAGLIKKDKRVKKLIIAGHSEGSLIAMVAAQHVKADKYISISGPAKPIDEIISWQIKQQLPALSPTVDSLFNRMKMGERIDSVPPMLYTLFRPSIQPYMISWMKYKPCDEIKKLQLPILILQGSHDYQVQQEEAEALHECNPKAMLQIIADMNHVLKLASDNIEQNKVTYTNPSLPLAKGLVTHIVNFIKN